MLTEHGGLIAAKKLIADPKYSDGLTKLWELKRLDLSVEALVLREPWSKLFTTEELASARKKLNELGYIE